MKESGDFVMNRQTSRPSNWPTIFLGTVMLCLSAWGLEAQTPAQTLYMPVLQATDSADVGIALSNPTLSSVTVTLTARDYTGAMISGTDIKNPATLTVPGSGQKALRAVEIFGTGVTGKIGWVQLDSSSVALKGFFLVFDKNLTFIDGAELQTTQSTRIIFPKVSGSADTPTTITFVNAGATDLAIAAVTFFDNNGRQVVRKHLPIKARTGFSGPVTNLLPEATGQEGYVVVDSSGVPFSAPAQSLVGFETYKNKLDVAALNAVPDSVQARIGYLPHLASQAGYTTRLALVNYSNTEQVVRITADGLEANGTSIGPAVTVEKRIPAYGRLEQTADSLFSLTGNALITGYIRWDTQGTTRGFVGYLDYGTNDGVLLSAVPAQSTSYSDLFFSHIAQGAGYFTGLAFLNPNTQTSSITIDAYNPDGQRVGSTTVTLAAGQRRSRLMNELFPDLQLQLGGYVRVSASRPVFAFELFGSPSLTFLANVAAQGVQLQPQASGRVVNANTGANVISSTGSSIAIPPGALQNDTPIQLGAVSTVLPPPSSTQKVVASVDAQPSGTQFKIPVTLTFPVGAQLDPGTQIPLLIFDPSTGKYGDSGFVAIVDDSGRTASAKVTHFTVYALPLSSDKLIQVDGINPASGLPGTSATISGSGFSATASDNVVTFAGPENTALTANVTAATTTSLTVTVPDKAVTGNVIVQVGGKTSTGVKFTVPVKKPVPAISSLNPNKLSPGVTTADVQVMGTNFDVTSVVKVDGAQVTTTFVDATLLLATLSGSAVAPGIHKVSVFTPPDGGGESSALELTVGFPVPVITSISPTSADATNTVLVTISGSGFTNSSSVLVDNNAAGGSYVSSSTMTVSLNAATSGPKMISVSNPSPGGGQSNSVVFTFTDPPVGSVTIITTTTSGTVGTTVTLEVEVRKRDNTILVGQAVAFTPVQGGGSVSATPVNTNSSGRASTVVTLGTLAGINRIQASAGTVSAFFQVTGNPLAASKIEVVASPASITAGGTGSTISGKIEDQYGNVRTGDTLGITFAVTAGSGTLSATTVNAVAGIATTTFTSVTTGSNTIQGTSGTLTAGNATVTVVPGAAASVTATGGTGQNGQAGVALGTAIKVQVKDQFNNVVPGVTVTFSAVNGGGSVSPLTAVTNANGEASTTATAGGTVGTQTFRATATGLTPVDFTATIAAGPAANLLLTAASTNLAANVSTNLTVTVRDSFNNTVLNASNVVTLSAVPAASVTFGTTTPMLTSGVGTTTFSATTATSYTVTASANGVISGTVTITVTAGAASNIVAVSGGGQSTVKTTAFANPLIAKVTDAFGNPVGGSAVTFAPTSGAGVVNPTGAQNSNATTGQVSVAITCGPTRGVYVFSATAALTGSPVNFSETCTDGNPASITRTSTNATSAVVNTTQTLTVLVKDANNNPVGLVNVTFAKTAGNGSVQTATVATDDNGVASTTITLGTTIGTNTFTATVGALTPVTLTVTGTNDVASQLIKVSGDAQTGNNGAALANALVVKVADQYTNAIAGASVTFTVTSGNGSVSPTGAQVTSASGTAQVIATLGIAVGTHTFRATSGALTADFTATATQSVATALVQTSTNNAATVNTTQTLTVQARDTRGNPVPGVAVTFAVTTGNGAVNPTPVTTDANGNASTTITLGQRAGTNTYSAAANGVTTISVSVTGNADVLASLAKISGDAQSGGVGAVLTAALVVEARDQFNNVKSGVSVTFTVTSGNGSVSPTGAQNTGADGRAQVTATLGTTSGTHNYTATAGAFTQVFSETATLIVANMTITAGNNQVAKPALSLLTPLKVHVTTSTNVVVPGAVVSWSVTAGGGSVSAATSTTDSNGDAVITATLGPNTGANTFKATLGSLNVTFTATAKDPMTVAPTTVTVNIASGTTAIGAYQVTISFDKNLVNLTSANVTGGSGAGFTGTPTTVNIDNVSGTVTLNAFQTGNSPAGNFTVATLTFTGLRGGTSALTTSGITVTDTGGMDASPNMLSLSASSLTIN